MSVAKLSVVEQEELIGVLRELQADSPRCKRRSPRRKVRQAMWLKRPAIASRPVPQIFSVSATDISSNGVGFYSRRKLETGEQVVIPLQFREGGGMLVLCSIRFCRSMDNGHYHLGASFIETTDDPNGNARIPRHWLQVNEV